MGMVLFFYLLGVIYLIYRFLIRVLAMVKRIFFLNKG
jgi:hypothetical protein